MPDKIVNRNKTDACLSSASDPKGESGNDESQREYDAKKLQHFLKWMCCSKTNFFEKIPFYIRARRRGERKHSVEPLIPSTNTPLFLKRGSAFAQGYGGQGGNKNIPKPTFRLFFS